MKKAMSREEVTLLLDLIVKRPAITAKETNAATNKLKEEAWNSLVEEFNETSRPARSKEQLKLKWDNLKKTARKRVSQCDREEAETEPLDGILERVLGMVGPGKLDAQHNIEWVAVDSAAESFSSSAKKRKSEHTVDESLLDNCKKKLQSNTGRGKKEEYAVIEKNLAIARYYRKKTEKVELEIQLLKIQLNKECNCSNGCKNSNSNSNLASIIKTLKSQINNDILNIKNDFNKNCYRKNKHKRLIDDSDSNYSSNDLSDS